MANKNAGRPTVLTANVVSILVSSFQSGMSVREACWQSVISRETYYSRLRSDEQFADTMARAQASATVDARKVVVEAIKNGDLSASRWWLEKKAPDEFGRNPKVDIEDTSKEENQFAAMSEEELDKFTEELYHIIKSKKPDFSG